MKHRIYISELRECPGVAGIDEETFLVARCRIIDMKLRERTDILDYS